MAKRLRGNIECPACGEFHPSNEPHNGCEEQPHLWWSVGLENDAPVSVIYALLGRLMYRGGSHDNWQVCPFIYGAPQCGKSLISEVMQVVIGRHNVGIIDACMEKQYIS